MGVLKINCYCDNRQMETMVKKVAVLLNSSSMADLYDVDEVFEGVRFCVDFDICGGRLSLKSAEVLDAEWDVLYEDSAVFTSRLMTLIAQYNSDSDEVMRQARRILDDMKY